MGAVWASFIKEWRQAFGGPSIWMQMAMFAASMMALTFFAGHFFDAGRADLSIWFAWYPWVMVLFVPVIGAGLWVQEFERGTLDLIWIGWVTSLQLSFGKWLALWGWQILALLFVLPLWLAINWLGSPDQGAILAGMMGAILMAGAFAGIAVLGSAIAPNTASSALLGVVFAIFLSLPVLGSLMPFLPPTMVEVMAGFSIPGRFADFSRGVLLASNVVYFISLTGVCVWISAWVVEARMRSKLIDLWIKIPVIILGFIVLNLLVPKLLMPVRLDMTSGQIYTLSKTGKNMVRQMEQQQNWTFFYSSSLAAKYPDIRQFGAQVRQTLASMQAISSGKLVVHERNPLPDSRLEDTAISLGMQPVMTDVGEPLYFGLADEKGAVIARFDPGRATLLEYDLLRQLGGIPDRQKPTLTMMDETDMSGRDWYVTGRKETAFFRQLEKTYKVNVSGTLSGANWLIVHPKVFSTSQEQQLAHRLRDANPLRLILLLDPYRESAAKPALNGLPRPGARATSQMPQAIADLGIHMDPAQVVIDQNLAAQVRVIQGGKARRVGDPTWLQMSPKNIVPKGPLKNASARGLVLASVGSLEATPIKGWQFQPLLQSTYQAMLVSQRLIANGGLGDELVKQAEQTGAKVLAGRLFHDTMDKQILIFADTDFINDSFYGKNDPVFGWQELADNGRFLRTAMDLLIQTPQLIDLAPKGKMNRPLTRIIALRAAAREQYGAEEKRLADQMADTGVGQQATEIRQQLRKVRRQFRKQVVSIERWLILINVILFPLGFALFGITRRR